jgi:hypothetical protein
MSERRIFFLLLCNVASLVAMLLALIFGLLISKFWGEIGLVITLSIVLVGDMLVFLILWEERRNHTSKRRK